MKRKNLISVLLLFILVFCTLVPAEGAASGGWTVNKKAPSYLSTAEKAVFNKAVKGLTGVSYTPVYTIANQTVAGRNYAFFCKAVTVTAKPVTSWKVMIVYENLKGDCKILSVNNFNFKNIKISKNIYKQASGDGVWIYNKKSYSSKVKPKTALDAFNKAKERYVGVSFTPLVLLGKQVVSGMNYRYLCLGKVSDAKGTVCLYTVDVYKDLKGSCSIKECNVVNISKYLNY